MQVGLGLDSRQVVEAELPRHLLQLPLGFERQVVAPQVAFEGGDLVLAEVEFGRRQARLLGVVRRRLFDLGAGRDVVVVPVFRLVSGDDRSDRGAPLEFLEDSGTM